MNKTLGQIYLEQLEAEVEATRKCLERITQESMEFKPTPEAMPMKSLAITVSEIPSWIVSIINQGDIDFATYERYQLKSVADLATHFDECVDKARKALENVTDEELSKDFSLKNAGQVLSTDTKKNSIDSSIRHLVHHRGQMTVYMRMCHIPIPRIYGPSGDDQAW